MINRPTLITTRAFFGEVDPVRRQQCGTGKTRDDSAPVEPALEHRTDPEGRVSDPKGHVSDPKGHVSEKWIRFSLARPAGSVLTDALIQEESIGWIPKGQVHFSRPML